MAVGMEALPSPGASFGGDAADAASERAASAEASGALAVVALEPAQCESFRAAVEQFDARWDDTPFDDFVTLARGAVAAVLTDEQRATIDRFGDEDDTSRPSVLLLRGCGVDSNLPPTSEPQEHALRIAQLRSTGGVRAVQGTPSTFRKDGQLTEAWTVGVMAQWSGSDVFGSPHGALPSTTDGPKRLGLNQVVPVQGKETMFANYGSKVNLAWHRDGGADTLGQAHEHTIPVKVALFCVRHDHEQAAETFFCDNRALCSAMAPDDLEALRTEPVLFHMRATDNVARHTEDASGWTPFELDQESLLDSDKHRRWFARPKPCIGGTEAWPIVSLQQDRDVDTEATAPHVATAYHALLALAAEQGFALRLQQGDLCIANNTGCCHGRSAYQPRFDGHDRWLQRLSTHPRTAEALDEQMMEDYFQENLAMELRETQKLIKKHAELLDRPKKDGRWGSIGATVAGAVAGAAAAAGWRLLQSRL